MMLPNNNYYPQPIQARIPYPTENSYPVLKGRPVASLDEARASIIDFDGSITYFPDNANHKIYTKQINPDGSLTLNTYTLETTPPPTAVAALTREEFDEAIKELNEKFDFLAKQHKEFKF